LPWNHLGWHSGGLANNTHISIEICEDNLTDRVYFQSVFKEAVQLCAFLCKQYNLNETRIICHSEGYKRGIASNHADVMHWFPKHGENMDTFRTAVKTELEAQDRPILLTRAEAQAIIQKKINFSNPAAVWAALETHRYADDLYHKFAMAMLPYC